MNYFCCKHQLLAIDFYQQKFTQVLLTIEKVKSQMIVNSLINLKTEIHCYISTTSNIDSYYDEYCNICYEVYDCNSNSSLINATSYL